MCQISVDILCGECTCKPGCGGCNKHAGEALYYLVEYLQLDIKAVPDDKTCTDILQKRHVPAERQNQEPKKFTIFQFYKADVRKEENYWKSIR